jgi:hypothetical protein
MPDLERSLARLHASAAGHGRDGASVVLYEDSGKKRLSDFLAVLRGAKAIRFGVIEAFETYSSDDLGSSRLEALVKESCSGTAEEQMKGDLQ